MTPQQPAPAQSPAGASFPPSLAGAAQALGLPPGLVPVLAAQLTALVQRARPEQIREASQKLMSRPELREALLLFAVEVLEQHGRDLAEGATLWSVELHLQRESGRRELLTWWGRGIHQVPLLDVLPI